MENRILLIADEMFGEHGEAAVRFSEILLCAEPTRSLQFILNAPLSYSIEQLCAKASLDIMGKQAGHIILGLGFRDLGHGKNPEHLIQIFRDLVSEIKQKTKASIYIVNIPPALFPEIPSALNTWNTALAHITSELNVELFDFASAVDDFLQKQQLRGKFARNLFDETGNFYRPTSFCLTFLALFLKEKFKEGELK